jgi:probable rRNA maturation factor
LPTRCTLNVSVDNASGCNAAPSEDRIEAWLRRAFEGSLTGELAIRIVSEAEGRALNQRYRGRSTATNVLAFAGVEPPADAHPDVPRHIGDLVLCAAVVEREAREQHKAPDAHWAHLSIHGVLHLLGFDHKADADARIMEQREVDLLAKLGFDDPYATER